MAGIGPNDFYSPYLRHYLQTFPKPCLSMTCLTMLMLCCAFAFPDTRVSYSCSFLPQPPFKRLHAYILTALAHCNPPTPPFLQITPHRFPTEHLISTDNHAWTGIPLNRNLHKLSVTHIQKSCRCGCLLGD